MATGPIPLIAGNWKMNGLRADAEALATSLVALREGSGAPACDMLVCPPATAIAAVADSLAGSGIALGGQDCHFEKSGAHTGDISPPMLADLGCAYVIVGHSERRANHGEDDGRVRAKAAAARASGLRPIICVGETAAERDAGTAVPVVLGQLSGSVPEGSASDIVIAYEPVWAIGTGRTPTLKDIAEVHAAIHGRLPDIADKAGSIRILYGGSVNPGNAVEILAVPHVNGALVGGASLKPDDFWAICQACP